MQQDPRRNIITEGLFAPQQQPSFAASPLPFPNASHTGSSPQPAAMMQQQQLDLAVRLEQEKKMLKRAQLFAAVENLGAQRGSGLVAQQPLQTAHLPQMMLSQTQHSFENTNNAGVNTLARHSALLNRLNNGSHVASFAATLDQQPMTTAAMSMSLSMGRTIDAKNELAIGSQLHSYSQRQNGLLAANQLAIDRLNDLNTRLPPPNVPASALGAGGLFQSSQVTTVPSTAVSLGTGGSALASADALLSRHIVQPDQAQTQLSVPPSLKHLQPQPFLPKKARKQRKKKPADKPKRPLSAYNLFFRDERSRILESIPAPAGYKKKKKSKKNKSAEIPPEEPKRAAPHGKIGFENLAKIIGKRWQDLSDREAAPYKRRAEEEMAVYRRKMEEWLAKQEGKGSSDVNSDVDQDAIPNKKRKKSCDEETDNLLASVQKKVNHLDNGPVEALGLLSAQAPCF